MLSGSHPVFPTPDIRATVAYYRDVLGFRPVEYLDVAEPHVCLYRDGIEIILTSTDRQVSPNREVYGYGYDAYLVTDAQEELLADIDGRWIGFGIKEE